MLEEIVEDESEIIEKLKEKVRTINDKYKCYDAIRMEFNKYFCESHNHVSSEFIDKFLIHPNYRVYPKVQKNEEINFLLDYLKEVKRVHDYLKDDDYLGERFRNSVIANALYIIRCLKKNGIKYQ